jgi:hypothetical protein
VQRETASIQHTFAFRYILRNITVGFVVRGGVSFTAPPSRARRSKTSKQEPVAVRSRSISSAPAGRLGRLPNELSSTIVAVKSASGRGRAESIRDVVDASAEPALARSND